jgi:IS5 family transposase
MEEMNYNLLIRWFVGLEMDDEVWDVTVFTKNRERLLAGAVAQKFFAAVVEQARGTGARGRKLLRDTHESTTDPEARLFRRSQAAEARPSYLGHVITENRNGLVVAACVTQSSTKAEREAGLQMLAEVPRTVDRKITLGADKGFQEERFIAGLRRLGVVPHVAEYAVPSKHWPNWLRPEEREDPGFGESQRKRKRVEQVFGWMKQVAGLWQTKFRGRRRVEWMFQLAMSALNLRRMQRLLAPAAG